MRDGEDRRGKREGEERQTNLCLVQLLISAGLNLYALPEPLLLHHMDPIGGGGDLSRVDII